KFQSTGAANCLCSNGALVLDYGAVGTKYKVLHHFVISSQTIDRKITTWSGLLHQLRFSFAYAFQQRQFAVVVIVDADAEVGFLRIFVCVIRLGDAEDRITGRHFDGMEE